MKTRSKFSNPQSHELPRSETDSVPSNNRDGQKTENNDDYPIIMEHFGGMTKNSHTPMPEEKK